MKTPIDKIKSLQGHPQPKEEMTPMKTRHEIINDAIKFRENILQIDRDEAYWNEHVRKPDEALINSDPDGQQKRWVKSIEKMLSTELLAVVVEGPDDIFAAPNLESAEERIAKLNREFADYPDNGAQLHAKLAAWPHPKSDHMDDLKKWDSIDY